MKTTTKNKGDKHERQETQKQTETQTVLKVIEPEAGFVVVSEPPALSSLKFFRITDPRSFKPFEEDIVGLFTRYAKRSGENGMEAREHLFDFITYCNRPDIYFLIGTDREYKCRVYCLGVAMPTGVFFIRQAVFDPKYASGFMESWQFMEKMAKQAGCRVIEGNTKRDEKAYGRWAKKVGMKRECTVFRKEITDG